VTIPSAPYLRDVRIHLATSFLFLAGAIPASAQCPDGSPPPCAGRSRPTAVSPALSVAVLTFANLTHDSADTYLAEGLANDISAQLIRIDRITVTSRSAARRVAPDAAPTATGRALNAAYLVTGGVQRGGQRVRVSVELIRAATSQTVWSEQYDRSAADLLTLQTEIATHVASGITGRLLPAERAMLDARPKASPAAYDHILRADFLITHRTVRDMERGLAEYETALEIDPQSPLGWARLGGGFATCADWGLRCRGMSNDSLRAVGRRAIDHALAIDSLLPEAHAARSALVYDANLAEGLRSIDRALALAPRQARYRANRGWLLAESLRLPEALAELDRAIALDNATAITWEIRGRILAVMRRFPEALADLDSALSKEPELAPAYFRRAELKVLMGDSTWRVDAAESARRTGRPPLEASWETLFEAYHGDTVRARIRLDSLTAANVRDGPLFYAALKLGRGDGRLAGMSAQTSIDPFWALYPWYDSIRGDPRFLAAQSRYRPAQPVP
jgi:TolB-like protein